MAAESAVPSTKYMPQSSVQPNEQGLHKDSLTCPAGGVLLRETSPQLPPTTKIWTEAKGAMLRPMMTQWIHMTPCYGRARVLTPTSQAMFLPFTRR